MRATLVAIPDVPAEWEQSHRVRVLAIDGKSPVLEQLLEWKKREPEDYKKLLRVLERLARLPRVLDEKHVKRDARETGIHEARAHRGHARLFFFYDEAQGSVVVCLHTYWKGRGSQDRAFESAARLMDFWKDQSREARQ